MELRNGNGSAVAAAVWLLCFVVVFGGGVSAEYSTDGLGLGWSGNFSCSSSGSPSLQILATEVRSGAVVVLAPPQPLAGPAPAPTAGADDLPAPAPVYSPAPERQVTTTPHFGFPLQPTVGVTAAPPVAGAPGGGGGEGYPFIGSNPTVPLPTGVTDTASVLPLPDTTQANGKVVGRASLVLPAAAPVAMVGLLIAFSVLLFN